MLRSLFFASALALSFSTHLMANAAGAEITLPANLPGNWSVIGRATIQTNTNSVVIQGGYVAAKADWGDAEMTVRMRAPADAQQVQLWAGCRCLNRDSRYVFALRGGHDNDIYLARYAPDGRAEFLGFAPLDFKPVPGVWYRLRVVMLGKRFQIYLNNEKLPRINVEDPTATWTHGSVALGGGWLPAEYADLQVKLLTAEERQAVLTVGDRTWAPPALDKEALRESQRAAYEPAKLARFGPQRTDLSLDGKWLFMPDYQLAPGQKPISPKYDDSQWNVMPVPEFWTPGLSWLHGETSFRYLKGVSVTKGVAESLYVQETRRVESYTFDWKKTQAAWYRDYIELPENLKGRRFELTFDAIAKVSEIWVNGIKVGAHTGMFGRINCDVTRALKPGRNVVAVHVISEADTQSESSNKVEGVAVTVPVTSKMLDSLPHGMFQSDVGGIWQPVKLTVTSPVVVQNVFVQPGLHGANVDLDVLNSTAHPAKVALSYEIVSVPDGATLYASTTSQDVECAAGETAHLRLTTPHLDPKLWSPEHPNLYKLVVHLRSGSRTIDTSVTRFGFRTFTTDGSKFLLNGHPYWLRGADPFPNTLRPNNAVLARRFMQIAHDGNVRVTRTHIVPFTSTWLDAADKIGVAVSYEGTWPWLMIKGAPPSKQLLKIWKDGFLSLIREYRNHPSILLWTVNNEMNFASFDKNRPKLLKEKWIILNDMIKAIRRTDPTRPIVAYSNYTRRGTAKGYHEVVQPNGFDDGDVDDAHRYYGWYDQSFFHLYDGQFWQRLSTPGRPLISQEMSTGYPNNDDGHPTRFYLFENYTPQALVGEDAYENANPAIFLKRQAFMTKELTETLRRTRCDSAAGVLLFSYFTWFQTPWSASQIKPWPTYYALKTALQPVLVSAELYGRHFYAGATVRRRVCIVNDSDTCAALPASQLTWEVKSGETVLAQNRVEVPSVPYYQNHWQDVAFAMPQHLPTPRVDGQLVLTLAAGGKVLSKNSYDIVLASADWANRSNDANPHVILIDSRGQEPKALSGLTLTTEAALDAATTNDVVIIGDAKDFLSQPAKAGRMKQFVREGGHVLLLNPQSALAKIFPDAVARYMPKQGEIVTMRVPESPIFSGIEPLDLAWFEAGDRRLPVACTGVYQIAAGDQEIMPLAEQCDLHGYLKSPSDVTKYEGTPLLEMRLGHGKLVASEMNLDAGTADPIARRLLSNLIRYLAPAAP